MTRARILLFTTAILFTGEAAAQYHHPVYILGGHHPASTLYSRGIFQGDAGKLTFTSLAPISNQASTITMDADNRHVVYTVMGTPSTSLFPGPFQSGIFRYDPPTMTLQTVMVDTLALYQPYHLLINQDGDYVFGCQSRSTSNVHTNSLMKLTPGSTLSTILSVSPVGHRYCFSFDITRNMDTGNYLVNNATSTAGCNYGILDVADDGTCTTWSTGGGYGWYGSFSMPLDHDTGWIEGQYYNRIYRLKPGNRGRTTVSKPALPGTHFLGYTCRFDLQSSASKRWVTIGTYDTILDHRIYRPPVVFYLDQKTCTVTSLVTLDPHKTTARQYNYAYAFDFFRGRHLQTVKIGSRRWIIYISCPNFAGKDYLLLLSAAGYRPGLKLPDGRTFHLNCDDFFKLSFNNWLRPWFNPGPLKLDSAGEATGTLDLSGLPPKLNMPFWMALAVLDPAAPNGIAYLPDTYVMRL